MIMKHLIMFLVFLLAGFSLACELPNMSIYYEQPFSLSASPKSIEGTNLTYDYIGILNNGVVAINATSIENVTLCTSVSCENEFSAITIYANSSYNEVPLTCSKKYYISKYIPTIFELGSWYFVGNNFILVVIMSLAVSYAITSNTALSSLVAGIISIIGFVAFSNPILFFSGIILVILGIALLYINQ